MDFNMEDFITEIESQPAIWNPSVEAYTNKHEKKKAWECIFKKFCPEFEYRTSSEKEVIAIQYQRKWKSLRDSYSRELLRLRKEITGCSASRRKQYIYFNQLKFLENITKPASSSIDAFVGKTDCDVTSEMTETNATEDVPDSRPSRSYEKSRRTELSEEDESFHAVTDNTRKIMANENLEFQDEDRLFMLSLVPELKKIPESFKLDVKIELLNVFKKAKLQCSAFHLSSEPS